MLGINRTLHIIYRHIPLRAEKHSRDPHKVRPDWFSYEVCFQNLLSTVKTDPLADRVKILILFDGTLDDFMEDFIALYWANESLGLDVQFIRAGSNANSFLIALNMIRSSDIPDTDLIYFLENDYMHQHGWVSKLFELYESGHQCDFVSLYDHRDKYEYEMYAGLLSKLIYTPTHHWRTVPSTCGTFILEKAAVLADYDVWTSNLVDYYLFPKLLSERGRVLLTPVPGLATHSMSGYLSPAIDWEKLARESSSNKILI